jgi:hypothetical protein
MLPIRSRSKRPWISRERAQTIRQTPQRNRSLFSYFIPLTEFELTEITIVSRMKQNCRWSYISEKMNLEYSGIIRVRRALNRRAITKSGLLSENTRSEKTCQESINLFSAGIAPLPIVFSPGTVDGAIDGERVLKIQRLYSFVSEILAWQSRKIPQFSYITRIILDLSVFMFNMQPNYILILYFSFTSCRRTASHDSNGSAVFPLISNQTLPRPSYRRSCS